LRLTERSERKARRKCLNLEICLYIFIFNHTPKSAFLYTPVIKNKRAQRAQGRSPEEKVKGHSVANNREPQGHNLINFGRGPFDDVIYLI